MNNSYKNFINKHVIVRDDKAGVYFGILKSIEANKVVLLHDVRKIYKWSGANTIEDIAMKGIANHENSKVTIQVNSLLLGSFDQIIICTKEAIINLNEIPTWTIH
jgi:small nuclear ribonucleoprotein (snRNP)-like protein